MEEVNYTNGIPQCPHCKKPTKRSGGYGTTTLMYFEPIYDENGNNINPDKNTHTEYWECLECGESYSITGNPSDGYNYR